MMWIVLVTVVLVVKGTSGSIKDEQLCGVGWRHFKGMCYSIQVTAKTWSQSRDDCNERESELIKLSDSEELNYVYNTFIRPLHGKSAWIGLMKVGQQFQWVDGSRLDFSNWNDGEPNNSGGNEKCVELFVRSGKWNDIACTQLRPFICKKGIVVKHPDTLISANLANVDFALQGYIISKLKDIDVQQCAALCFSDPDCYSINFADSISDCELNNSTKAIAHTGAFVMRPGYIYYD